MENDNSARHEPQARIHTKAADDARAAALNHNKRPGVSDATLLENGIEFTAPAAGGCTGFQIPFYTFEASSRGRVPVFDEAFPETQFCRQRLAIPRGNQKYSQPSGTRSHVYFPLGLADLIRRLGYLIIVEGEAKAVALVEAGYPAIGITGIDSFQKQGALLPELVELLEWMLRENIQLTAIFFLGDADTCMNAAFSTAAIRLRDLLSGRFEAPLKLPRMPVADLERAKGIDDLNSREEVPGSDQTAAEDQLPFILGWLSCGCRCLYLGGGEFFPNQCLILCGPVSAGKNVMQDIIMAVLGQRVVDPFAFLEGSTGFNGELLAAEHWAVASERGLFICVRITADLH